MLRFILSFTWFISVVSTKVGIHGESSPTWRSKISARGGNVSPSSSSATMVKKKKKTATSQIDQPASRIQTSNSPVPSNATITQSNISSRSANKETSSTEHMPSLFMSPNESIYDKYAACVAATEGLRRSQEGKSKLREDETYLFRGRLPWNSFRITLKNSSAKINSEEEKRKHAQYILQSSKIIRSLGLTVSQFNQISREVARDISLKERVSVIILVMPFYSNFRHFHIVHQIKNRLWNKLSCTD